MLIERLLARRFGERLRVTPDVDPAVAEAMCRVGRHRFLRPWQILRSYDDRSLSIGFGQSISQPTFIAQMISAARIGRTDRVLEIGTGSGFTAAVLAHLARDVVSVECIPKLADRARRRLERADLANVSVILGDGFRAEGIEGAFDVIVVMAGGPEIPEAAMRRLRDGGRLLIPVGERRSEGHVEGRLLRVSLVGQRRVMEELRPCSFVPLIGADGYESREPISRGGH